MRHGTRTATTTTTAPRGGDQIKLGPEPQAFALKFITGKDVQSNFPGGRVMFSAVDGRKIFLNDEDANELEHALLDQRIQPGQPIVVSRVQHGRGGGFAMRVELAEEPRADRAPAPARHGGRQESSFTEALLEKSVELARSRGAGAFISQPTPETPRGPQRMADIQEKPEPPASSKGKMANLLAGALIASIDGYKLAAEYAASKGIPVKIEFEIRAEDLRQSATAMLIEYWRNGGTRA